MEILLVVTCDHVRSRRYPGGYKFCVSDTAFVAEGLFLRSRYYRAASPSCRLPALVLLSQREPDETRYLVNVAAEGATRALVQPFDPSDFGEVFAHHLEAHEALKVLGRPVDLGLHDPVLDEIFKHQHSQEHAQSRFDRGLQARDPFVNSFNARIKLPDRSVQAGQDVGEFEVVEGNRHKNTLGWSRVNVGVTLRIWGRYLPVMRAHSEGLIAEQKRALVGLPFAMVALGNLKRGQRRLRYPRVC